MAEEKKYIHYIEGQHEEEGVLYLPSTPKEHLERIARFPLSSEDMLVATFSKSGKCDHWGISDLISSINCHYKLC